MKEKLALLMRLALVAGIMLLTEPGLVTYAQGLSFPAEINKSFTPISIEAGGISRLRVTVYNPNSFDLLDTSWTDNLVGVQSGLLIANPANISNSCGGSVTAVPGTTVLSLSGGTVPLQEAGTPGECTVEVDITSTTPGNLINTIPAGAVSATGDGNIDITNTTPASATLTVIPVEAPPVRKRFEPETVWVGQTSQLRIEIVNLDTTSFLTGVTLTDTLPANVVLANPPLPANALSFCGVGASLTAVAGGSFFTLNNGTIRPKTTCVIRVNVVSSVAGTFTNTIPENALQTQQGVTNEAPATADLNVQDIGVIKDFSPDPILAGGQSTLTITLQNPTGTAYTGVSISDTMPGTDLTVVPGTASTTCGGTASTTPPRTVNLTDGTIPPGTPLAPGTCTITVLVTVPVDSPSITYLNSIPAEALSTDQDATNIVPAEADLSIIELGGPVTGSKSFFPATINAGEDSRLRINITAPGDTALTNVIITDNLPPNVTISNSTPATVSASCGASAVLTAVTRGTTITLTNGTIPAGATCQIDVYVTSAFPGTYVNTIPIANVTNDEDRPLNNDLTATLNVFAFTDLFSVSKDFFPDAVTAGGTSTLTITLQNANDLPLVNVTLQDDLPGDTINGIVVAPVPNATTTCGSGVIMAIPGTQTISMSGGTIPAQVGGVPGSCTITVDVQGRGFPVTRTNTIPPTNVSGEIQGTGTVINPLDSATASITVADLSIGIVKGFDPLTVFGGSASTMSVELINPNRTDLVGIGFTDTMPVGMFLANPPNLNTGTCGGALSGTPGNNSFTFSGGFLPASTSCTLTLSVTMNVNGNLTNVIPASTVTTTNGATNPDPAEASLTNLAGASISKFFSPNPIAAGEYSLLTITIVNTANVPLSGIGLLDTLPGLLPVGIAIAGPPAPAPVNNCGGTLAAATGSQDIQLSDGTLAASSSCTIVVAVTGSVPGDYQNIIPIGALTTNEGATNTQPAIDTLTITGSTELAALGDYVWNDLDADGIQDAGEAGIEGVTVRLLDENGNELATTTTDANGFYSFTDLTPGTYRVDFVPPAGYAISPANQGGDDAVDSDADPTTGETANVTLAAGEINNTLDAGLYQPAALGNFVWLDADFDGIQDPGEIGVANVTVRLLDENGNELATTTTNANGLYSFTDLPPGTYRVAFVPPAEYAISPQDQGANDAVDSDASPLTGETANVTLAAGETNITLDAGLFLQAPDIQVTKTIPVVNFLNPGVFEITYSINVLNTGNVPLSNIQVTDDLTSTFPSPASFSIISLLSGTFEVNTDYDGDTDIDLLIGSDTLDPGASGVITLVVQVDTGGEESSYLNIVDVFGLSPSEQEVTDFDSISGPSFIDPALTKAVDPALAAVGDLVTFTITVFNNGNVPATGVVVTDPLPDNLDYVSATSIDAATLSPRGTITLIPPRTVQVDIGTIDVNDVLLITILTQVNSRGQPPIENQVTLVADAPPQDISPDPLQNNTAVVSLNIRDDDDDDDGGGGPNRPRVGGDLIPVTGFAPGRVTDLSGLPVTMYNTMNDVILEVPALKLEMPIVGIPKKGNTWDVNWLLNQAGWLEGSAFPGFSGNSVLTSHVTLPYGQAGPFADLHKLRLGDKVFVHAFGNLYIYEVKSIRELFVTNPSILQHEDNSWLTLVTCADYNEKAETYLKRLVVRAVLIQAQPERWWSTWP